MGSDTSLFWTISFDTCFRKILKNCLPKKFKKKTYLDTWVSVSPVPPTVAKYRMLYLADTVLPAPDSPASQCWQCNTTFFFFSISLQCDQYRYTLKQCCGAGAIWLQPEANFLVGSVSGYHFLNYKTVTFEPLFTGYFLNLKG